MPFYQRPDYFNQGLQMGWQTGANAYSQGYEQYWQNKAREQQMAFQYQQAAKEQDRWEQEQRRRELEFKANQQLAMDRMSQDERQFKSNYDLNVAQFDYTKQHNMSVQQRQDNNDQFNHKLQQEQAARAQAEHDVKYPWGTGFVGRMMSGAQDLLANQQRSQEIALNRMKMDEAIAQQKAMGALPQPLRGMAEAGLGPAYLNSQAMADRVQMQQQGSQNDIMLRNQLQQQQARSAVWEMMAKNNKLFPFFPADQQWSMVDEFIARSSGGNSASVAGQGVPTAPMPQQRVQQPAQVPSTQTTNDVSTPTPSHPTTRLQGAWEQFKGDKLANRQIVSSNSKATVQEFFDWMKAHNIHYTQLDVDAVMGAAVSP